jgi:hypothetical protein
MGTGISGLYYKHIMIVNDDTSVINKFEASLIDDARVVIYNCYMFIVQATGIFRIYRYLWISLKPIDLFTRPISERNFAVS